jgi:hypothetical protein
VRTGEAYRKWETPQLKTLDIGLGGIITSVRGTFFMQPIYTNGEYSVVPLIVAYAVVSRDGKTIFKRASIEDAVEDADMLALECGLGKVA